MDDYWNSVGGLRHQWRARILRRRDCWLQLEPEQKGHRGTRQAPCFRVAARAGINAGEAYPRAPLAVDLDFAGSRRQSPSVQNLAKNYLDLLGRGTTPGDEKPILYHDDRQVKMLFVRGHHTSSPDAASIRLECCPRRDAVSVMELVSKLTANGIIEPPEAPQDPDFDATAELRRLARSPVPKARDLAALLRRQYQADTDNYLLRVNDYMMNALLLSHARSLIAGVRPDRDDRLDRLPLAREALFAHLQRIDLPPLPSENSDGFRQDVANRCQAFVRDNVRRFPLLAPMRLTFFLVQPLRGRTQTKDLDNVVRETATALADALSPLRNPLLELARGCVAEQGEASPATMELLAQAVRRLDAAGRHAFASYQIIELARIEDDPPEGLLTVVLGHGENRRSIWAHADDRLGEYLDSN